MWHSVMVCIAGCHRFLCLQHYAMVVNGNSVFPVAGPRSGHAHTWTNLLRQPQVRPRQRGRPAAPDTIAPAVVVASTRSARGRTQDDSSRARARGEASKGTTRNSSVGSTAAKPAGRSSAQERRTSRAAMPAASAMEPHAPADTVDVEFSTVSEHAAAPTAEQPEQPAMTGVGAAHAAPRLTEPQPVPAAHVGTASTAPGSLPPATVSDELVVKVSRSACTLRRLHRQGIVVRGVLSAL